MIFSEKISRSLVIWNYLCYQLFHVGPPHSFFWMFTGYIYFFVYAFQKTQIAVTQKSLATMGSQLKRK